MWHRNLKFARQSLVVALLQLMLAACAGSTPLPQPAPVAAGDADVVQALRAHYEDWRGVRYRLGGLSRSGIDCSGFVYLAFRDRFGRAIPRTTELQSRSGRVVNPGRLRPGDLVFFKTGWKKHHVGIYLDKGRFVHASTSRGVMTSRLDNPYWSDAFWMARRM